MMGMIHGFVAQPLAAIGLVAMFYGLHWFCCCRKCKVGQKALPAPQCVGWGWCGGCMAAHLGLLLAMYSALVAGVSGEVSTAEGLQTHQVDLGLTRTGAVDASVACLSP